MLNAIVFETRKPVREKTAVVIAVRIVCDRCIENRSLAPVRLLVRNDYPYGTRKQLKGNLVDYIKYCKRLNYAIAID